MVYSTIVWTQSLKQYIVNYKLMRLFWILNLQLQSFLGEKNAYFTVIRKQFTQISRNNSVYHIHVILFFPIKWAALNDRVNISICFPRVQKRNFSLSACFLKQGMTISGKDKMGNYKPRLKVCICGGLVLWISKSKDKGCIIHAHDSLFNLGLHSYRPK